MIKLILASALTLSLACTLLPSKEEKVYICDSKKSVAYHKKEDCSGLKKCNHTIKKVTVKDAKDSYSRRECKICY